MTLEYRGSAVRERWIVETKKGDFNGLAKMLGVSPLVVRCMINRGVEEPDEMKRYLFGTPDQLHDPFLMKGMESAVSLIGRAKEKKMTVAIASDFDCDGIFSGYLLWKGFQRLQMDSRIYTPDRVQEGYGLNERIIDQALAEGRLLLITCDNGIAANEQVRYAKERGMTVIVTDHHEVQETLPEADVVLDPKQPGETYPFRNLCGAGVAFKLICALYDYYDIPQKEKDELLEYVAIATVADVMELQGENRLLVRYGLPRLERTENAGLRTLIEAQELKDKKINAGHIGFVLGPCFNAAGRIATVEKSFSLLMEENAERAKEKAEELKAINASRKKMTEEGAEQAFDILEQEKTKRGGLPAVIVLLLPDIHESLAGIIAGRIKERYGHPVILFTRTKEGLIKGSGRSIEAYHMFNELMKCKEWMIRFGGHKMAAGMTMAESDLPKFTQRLNDNAKLTEEDFRPVVRIDAAMPIGYISETLIQELEKMEPFGVGNPKPVFAEQHFRVLSARRMGRENNYLKLRVQNDKGNQIDAVYFGNAKEWDQFVVKEWGQTELRRMYAGQENRIDAAFTYFPMVNEFRGSRTLQIQITGFCCVAR